MRTFAWSLGLFVAWSITASAQTAQDLLRDGKGGSTDNVLTYGMGYHQQRYSPLKQINKKTVKRLVPVWSLSLANEHGEQGQPLVYNGVMYVSNVRQTVAIDVGTGRQIWATPLEWEPAVARSVCCGLSNRGVALYNGKVFVASIDAHIRALDAKTGKVKIPGFYEDVVEPTKAEVKSFLASGFQVNNFKQAYGFHTLRTNDPAEIMRRIWAAPTFEIHGLTGGYHGPGVKTVVPGHGELKVSMRLVPNQTPEKVFALLKRHVARINPDVKVGREGMLQPFKGLFEGPYVEAVKRAAKAGFGKEPAFIREGGSIGAVVTMQKAWKIPILFMGLSLPEHGYHAPNEHFDWGQASGGMKAFAHYFTELAKMGRLG